MSYQSDRRSTSIDVARRAGVSQSTVSLVLAGKAAGRVSPDLQEKIFEIAQDLGYRPNIAARTLRLGYSQVIALVVPDITNPFFAALLAEVEQIARRHGYTVVLLNTKNVPDWQQLLVKDFAADLLSGFLFCGLNFSFDELAPAIKKRTVLMDAPDGLHRQPSILQLDITGGMHAALVHLIQLGHRRIVHLAAAVEEETFRVRQQVYQRVLREAGLPLDETSQRAALFTVPSALEAARQLLAAAETPTAILCDSDFLAIGAYQAAQERGLRIPEELSIIGFDDSLIAQILTPALTTVAIPVAQMSELAFAMLLALLEGRACEVPPPVPLQLIIRASTAQVTRKQ
ncbi:LacI family DNA-binding transcriptional regulator [Tengunoibacter tsumagoiensis]|uniref:DNA-binding transcriptional regulator CytR n=1 Tax=Tengunoibacter tsumagoiensis TaxID=2014871 RepID=A0A401ZYD4_9CHLR|nr:LacI family DNA-binding transcriptional regulator [Tengunoibacter tsumagoiensis]GCE11866.1 DNA-binding transcriptional regulator CytR [Tengunoibacter tsumagoiensis]